MTDPTPGVSEDPLAEILASLQPSSNRSGTEMINEMFKDRPQVLEELRKARAQRKVGIKTLATAITKMCPDRPVGESAVKTWLASQGID